MTEEGGISGEYVANDGKLGLWSRETSNQIVEEHGELLSRAEQSVRTMWSIAFPDSDELSRKAFVNKQLPLWKTTNLPINTNGHANHGISSNGEIVRDASPRIQFNPSDEQSLVRTWFHETLHIQETDDSKRTNQYVEGTTTLVTMLTERKLQNATNQPNMYELSRYFGMHFREAYPLYRRYQELISSGMEESECYQLLVHRQHNDDQTFINVWNERVGSEKNASFADLTWFARDPDNLALAVANQIKKAIGKIILRQ